MNELLFILTLIVNFGGILLCYKLFKKTGLFVWIGFATIAANIEVAKCVDLFGLSATLGNVIYGTIFLATDILNEIYGAKKARLGVWIGFFTMIVFTIMSQLNLLFAPNAEDMVSGSLQVIFSFMPRICFASMLAYLVSNMLDTYSYDWIRTKLPADQFLWIRNNGSTMTSQIVDTILFTLIAFYGVFRLEVVFELMFTTYILKFIISVCDTPFIYLAKKIHQKSSQEK